MSSLNSVMLVCWTWLSASFSTVLVALNTERIRRLGTWSLPLISALGRERLGFELSLVYIVSSRLARAKKKIKISVLINDIALNLCMLVQACNPSTGEVESGDWGVQDQPQLYSEFQVSSEVTVSKTQPTNKAVNRKQTNPPKLL